MRLQSYPSIFFSTPRNQPKRSLTSGRLASYSLDHPSRTSACIVPADPITYNPFPARTFNQYLPCRIDVVCVGGSSKLTGVALP